MKTNNQMQGGVMQKLHRFSSFSFLLLRRIRDLSLIATLLLVTSVCAAEQTSPVGYYEAAPGKAGEYNRLSVSELSANSYSVSVTTVYCAYAFSPDCSNARGGQLNFSARRNGNTVVSEDMQSGCKVTIVFKGESATIQQTGECPTNPYGPGSKPYVKRSPIPKTLSD